MSIFYFRNLPNLLPQQDPEFVHRTFASIAPLYDFANHFLSAGMDFLWRGRVAQSVRSKEPRRILDLATGSGDLAVALRKACPQAFIVATDFCFPMLLEAHRKKVPHLVQGDALCLPFGDNTFDVVTVAFGLRNMASWTEALREMKRVLNPEGLLVILDFSIPRQFLWRVVYRLYLHHILPLLAAEVTGRRGAYKYLGESIEAFPSGLAMEEIMKSCGFSVCRSEEMCLGIVTMYEAWKRVPEIKDTRQ